MLTKCCLAYPVMWDRRAVPASPAKLAIEVASGLEVYAISAKVFSEIPAMERAPALVGDKGRPVVEPIVTAEHSVIVERNASYRRRAFCRNCIAPPPPSEHHLFWLWGATGLLNGINGMPYWAPASYN